MADDPIPDIEQEHYDTIRELAPDLPAEYDQWLLILEQVIAERRKRGHQPQFIRITRDDFAAFLARKQGNTQELLRCAISIARASPTNAKGEYDPLGDNAGSPDVKSEYDPFSDDD